MNGHGHVIPNANGTKARCGGPAICPQCREEFEQLTNGTGVVGAAHNVAPHKPMATFQPPVTGSGLPFESVLGWLRGGRKVTRKGWNGAGMYIYMIPARYMYIGETNETESLVGVKAEGVKIEYAPRVDMQYADGRIGVWTPTFDDLFASDWSLLM